MITLLKTVTLCILLCPFFAFSLTIDEAKQQGIIGESLSGYLAVVNQSRQDAFTLTNKINGERELKYSEIAQKNNLSTKEVAKIAGQKLVERAETGEYVRGINGQWLRKK